MPMKNNITSGLLSRNKISNVSADEHGKQDYLEAIQSFARLTYESVYVIDYEKMAFEYVSENPLFLGGYTAQEVMELGYEFYFQNVPQEELELLNRINQTGFDFFEQLPQAEKKHYTITYDFHLRNKEGKLVLINHKLTPLFLTREGKMWKSICIVSISNHRQPGNVLIARQGTEEIWQLDTTANVWCKAVKPKLTKRETEILQLYAQGLTINQIAEKIFVAPDTVKYHRRRIFERLNVSSIAEALAYAVNSKLI